MGRDPGKRKLQEVEQIDLTHSSDEECLSSLTKSHRNKHARFSVHSPPSSHITQASRATLPTPPSSSQPSSSTAGAGVGYGSDRNSIFSPSSYPNDLIFNSGLQFSTQDFDEDVRREIDLTRDEDDDLYDSSELYGILNTKVVGVRYYDGRATSGECVVVQREPNNQYDSNAISVKNVRGVQIGHLPRQIAAKLAPLIDSKDLLVEGALTGEKGAFDCPLGLKLFGSSDPMISSALKKRMQDLRLPVSELIRAEAERKKKEKDLEKQKKAAEKAASGARKGGGASWENIGSGQYASLILPVRDQEGQTMEELLSSAHTYNSRDIQDVVNKFAVGEEVLSEMEMAEQPKKMATTLLPYQRQGLQWMLDHESPKLPGPGSKEVVQLWKNDRSVYSNIATNFSTTKTPRLASGGILADDMGLGKTIQILSLIMADLDNSKRPTLIIAPLSVMSNWKTQATAHVHPQYAPRVLIYHGTGKKESPRELKEYDIVITTYQTMTLEHFPPGKNKPEKVPSKTGLYSVQWRRVVIDEGHQIRNPKAKMSQAACALTATSRWVLTGTPIVNSLKDLFSHVKFLQLDGGLAQYEIFNGTLIRPLKDGDPAASLVLRALMSTLCLRRMKDMKFIDLKLPGITSHKYPIKFLPQELEKYEAFQAEAKGLLQEVKARKGTNNYTHLLEVLLRMRQVCNHWKMCGEDRINKLMELIEENTAIDIQDPAKRRALQDLLQLRIDSREDCPVCIDTLSSPVITACAHTFCTECIENVITQQHKCPMCRTELADSSCLVQPATDFGADEQVGVEIDLNSSSSKIEALIQILQASAKQTGTKTVVFSQWTSFLDIVQTQLAQHGMVFARLDGRMTASKRDAAIAALDSNPSCTILLASLSACSVGVNLVAANQVILADSWWAPAIEDQAVDRVYRLGQKQSCRVIRLVMQDSIEDQVLEVQAKKRKLAGLALGEKESAKNLNQERAGRLQDIEMLLR